MSKKIYVILFAVGVLLLVFTVIFDFLSSRDIITTEFDTTPFLYIGILCGLFSSILAGQAAAKKKKGDSDKK